MDSPISIISLSSSVNSNESDEDFNSTVTMCEDEGELESIRSLWDEVTIFLDRNERVDRTNAFLALEGLRDAILHSKMSPIAIEAQAFIGANMSKLVAMLLEYLDVGDVSPSEKLSIKTTFSLAIKVIASHLEKSSESGVKSKTLSAFTIIFDEVDGFEGGSCRDLITTFREANGFYYLGRYLAKFIATPDFPRLDEISTILKVANKFLSSLRKYFGNNEAKMAFRNEHGVLLMGIMMICRGVMYHLVSLSDATLLNLDDDLIDICDQVEGIHSAFEYYYPNTMSDYFDLYRIFIFRLLDSSAVTLKLLAWKEVNVILKTGLRRRPPPRAYLVQGAGVAAVNGQYEFDANGIDVDGYVTPTEPFRVRYFKCSDGDDKTLVLGQMKTGLLGQRLQWYLAEYDDDSDDEVDHYRSEEVENDYHIIAPQSGWRCTPRGGDPPPKVTSLGLVTPREEECSTLEHNTVAWIFQNNVLTLATQDATSTIVSDEVETTKKAMLKAIEQVLDLILQTFPLKSEIEITCTLEDSDDDHEAEAASFTELIMKHILLLANAVIENLGKDFMNKTCEQLKEICERITTPTHRHIVDYHIFRCLLDLKLNSSSCTSIIELGKAFRVDPENDPAQALFVDGAGSDIVNGHYDLNVGDYVTYTKRNPTVDDGTVLTIHQCLYGPDSGCWVISQHDEGQPFSDMTSDYYINRSGRKNVPPKTGWIECGSGVFPPPELIPIGSLQVIDGIETEEMHDDSDLIRSALLNQHQLWGMLQQHSVMSAMPASMITEGMKQSLSESLASLCASEMNKMHQVFARTAREIIGSIYHFDGKRQSLITEFFKVRKREEPNQGARFNCECKKIKLCSPLKDCLSKDQDDISVVPMDISLD